MLKFLKSKEIYDENDNYVNTVDHLIIKDLTGTQNWFTSSLKGETGGFS